MSEDNPAVAIKDDELMKTKSLAVLLWHCQVWKTDYKSIITKTQIFCQYESLNLHRKVGSFEYGLKNTGYETTCMPSETVDFSGQYISSPDLLMLNSQLMITDNSYRTLGLFHLWHWIFYSPALMVWWEFEKLSVK